MLPTTTSRRLVSACFSLLFVRTARRPTSGNRPWLQHRRRRGRSRGLLLPEYDTAGDALDEPPAPIASAPPADDPVHETIEAVQPGAGEWGRHRVDPHTVAGHREVGGTIVSVPPNHVAPRSRRGDASEVRRVGARVLRESDNGSAVAPRPTGADDDSFGRGSANSLSGTVALDARRACRRRAPAHCSRGCAAPDVPRYGDLRRRASNSTDRAANAVPRISWHTSRAISEKRCSNAIRSLCRLLQYSNERHPSFRFVISFRIVKYYTDRQRTRDTRKRR